MNSASFEQFIEPYLGQPMPIDAAIDLIARFHSATAKAVCDAFFHLNANLTGNAIFSEGRNGGGDTIWLKELRERTPQGELPWVCYIQPGSGHPQNICG